MSTDFCILRDLAIKAARLGGEAAMPLFPTASFGCGMEV